MTAVATPPVTGTDIPTVRHKENEKARYSKGGCQLPYKVGRQVIATLDREGLQSFTSYTKVTKATGALARHY